jgi:uncharacterized protein (TIGR03067 family)
MRVALLLLVTATITFAKSIRQDDKTTDLDRFQGEWGVVSATFGGQAKLDGEVQNTTFVFKGDKVTVVEKNAKREHQETATFTLDPAKKPRQITIVPDPPKGAAGDRKERVVQGIYAFEEKLLKICFIKDGGMRPTDFAAPDAALLVLQRKSP